MVLAKNQYKHVRVPIHPNPPCGVLCHKGNLIFICVTGRGGGKHTIGLCSCSFLMSKKGKKLQFQLLLALCFQTRLVSWMDGISNEAAKCSIKSVHCYIHVPADYTTGNFFRKQTLKEVVPDLFHFLCAEPCLVQVTFIIRPLNKWVCGI